MSKIYLHYDDKTLILDPSENLMYPLLGSLLKWDNLRVAFAVSLTQSTTDNNAGFFEKETLPIVSGLPLLNRVSFGLKNKGPELPGEVGSSFVGFSNAATSSGSSVGFYDSTIVLTPDTPFRFNVNLAWTGANHVISGSSTTLPLSIPFSNSGTTSVLPVGTEINFGGNIVYLDSTVSNLQEYIQVSAPSPVSISNSQINGFAISDVIKPVVSLGASIGASHQYSSDTSVSKAFQFPASFVMQGSTNYATIVVMDFVVANRGLSTQTIRVGYEVIPNEGDTSPENLEAKMAAYSPSFQSATFNFNTTMPTAFFVRWPFNTTRLRMHSLAIKKF